MSKLKRSDTASNNVEELFSDPGLQALVDRLKGYLKSKNQSGLILDMPLAACITRLRDFHRNPRPKKEIARKKKKVSKREKG